MQSTRERLLDTDFPEIRRRRPEILQVNLGYTCNQSCTHCHVNAGPSRTEQMDRETVDQVLEVLAAGGFSLLDITGGAPEMNPHFRYLVSGARQRGVEVMDRCNLTILDEPGFEWLLPFLAGEDVTVTASLPCYSEENVDRQRGAGVFGRSIGALQRLNDAGYGRGRHTLNLVYNPGGASLPPPQESLEQDYKRILREEYGIRFDNLFTLANMPISRFGAVLLARGEFEEYMQLLKRSYTEENLDGLMCRNTISVDWRGYLYDCDFNQMLDLPMSDADLIAGDRGLHLKDLLNRSPAGWPIRTGNHCYGCTAGQGSSCGGALS